MTKKYTLTETVYLSDESEPILITSNGVVCVFPNPMIKPNAMPIPHSASEQKYKLTVVLTKHEDKQ